MTVLPETLEEQITELYFAVAEAARRNRNRKRTGEVVEVNAEEGWARVELLREGSNGKPFLTGKIPWREQAMGAARTHFPPSVGQRVVVVSESGDLTDAEIETALPSDETPRPSSSGEEYVLVDAGGTRIVATGDGLQITTGALTFTADSVDFNQG